MLNELKGELWPGSTMKTTHHARQMALHQSLEQLEVITPGNGFTRLNEQLNDWIDGQGLQQGMLHLTCLHTSASLTINENADPRVLQDLQNWMDAVVPQDGSGPLTPDGARIRYSHDDEGRDDMPAHIRTALTSQTLSLSIDCGKLLLGTWQGVYLWEHRSAAHKRRIACHAVGVLKPSREGLAAGSYRENATTLLQRRNTGKLNALVQARHDPEAWATDGGADTDVDLLVDRLHEIAQEE